MIIVALLAAIAFQNYTEAWRRIRVESCIANLKSIDMAKTLWAFRKGRDISDVPSWRELIPEYLKETPVCPSGGTYFLTGIKGKPICTIADHNL